MIVMIILMMVIVMIILMMMIVMIILMMMIVMIILIMMIVMIILIMVIVMIILIMVVAITVIEDDVNERNDVNNNDGGDYGTEENIDHETVGDGTDGAKDYNVSRDVGGGNDGD